MHTKLYLSIAFFAGLIFTMNSCTKDSESASRFVGTYSVMEIVPDSTGTDTFYYDMRIDKFLAQNDQITLQGMNGESIYGLGCQLHAAVHNNRFIISNELCTQSTFAFYELSGQGRLSDDLTTLNFSLFPRNCGIDINDNTNCVDEGEITIIATKK